MSILLQAWSKRIQTEIRIFDGMEEVPQPEYSCECENSHTRDDFTSFDDEL